jgi:hypothetical protein
MTGVDAADACFGLIAESFGCRGLPLWVAKAGHACTSCDCGCFQVGQAKRL